MAFLRVMKGHLNAGWGNPATFFEAIDGGLATDGG